MSRPKKPAKESPKPGLPAAVAELLEAAENSVYWGWRQHALDAEEGKTDLHVKPGHLSRLQAATKALRAAI